MAKSLEERVAEIEARQLAQSIIQRVLVEDAWPNAEHRAERREYLCRQIEHLLGSPEVNPHARLHVQTVLDEFEAAFRTERPAPDTNP